MKQFDIGIIHRHEDDNLNGDYAIIIEDYLESYYLVEHWSFELNNEVEVTDLKKEYLRLATEYEIKEFQIKFKEYCDKNASGNG